VGTLTTAITSPFSSRIRPATTSPHTFVQVDAQLAVVALHLGMRADAERLYTHCGRYDLLGALHRASGRWDEALRVAQDMDPLHAPLTQHLYGRHLEAMGDIPGAIKAFERAGTAAREVSDIVGGAEKGMRRGREGSPQLLAKAHATISNEPGMQSACPSRCWMSSLPSPSLPPSPPILSPPVSRSHRCLACSSRTA